MNLTVRLPNERLGHSSAGAGATKAVETVRPDIATLMAIALRLIDQHGAVVLYFTAVSHGAGTSTIARELAIAAARSPWCKVALVDLNVGALNPVPHGGTRGLLDVPEDSDDLPFRRSWFGDAEVMEGVLTGEANTLPSVDAVRSLLVRLRQQFRLIVIDAPPIASARHVAAFSTTADGVILVVEAERTRGADLERARNILDRLGANVLGVVLNKRRSWVPRRLSRLIWGEAP